MEEQIYYYDTPLTGPELDAALAKIPEIDQTLTQARAAATAAESWAHGGTNARAGEATDNSRYWATQAAAEAQTTAATAAAASASSAQAAASAAEAASSAAAAARTVQTAQQVSAHPPVIQNGRWWLWDIDREQYRDSGLPALLVDENSGQTLRMWFGTVAEYNALERVEPDVYYNILEGGA